jgi:hypothetical protein
MSRHARNVNVRHRQHRPLSQRRGRLHNGATSSTCLKIETDPRGGTSPGTTVLWLFYQVGYGIQFH